MAKGTERTHQTMETEKRSQRNAKECNPKQTLGAEAQEEAKEAKDTRAGNWNKSEIGNLYNSLFTTH